MTVRAVDEFNEGGHLIYAENYLGAYVRGSSREEALRKFPQEIRRYRNWCGDTAYTGECRVEIVQEKYSGLCVSDADSDVLFDSERPVLTREEYGRIKSLVLCSARDFQLQYDYISIPDTAASAPRRTFYGEVPRTPREMYIHTMNVNNYYFGEIGVDVDNGPDIVRCRIKGFAELEKRDGFLSNEVYTGAGDEQWTLRKVCRRFVWHDRIHARAMYRMAAAICAPVNIANPFWF